MKCRFYPKWWHQARGPMIGRAVNRLVADPDLRLVSIEIDAEGFCLRFAVPPTPADLAKARQLIDDPGGEV